MLLAAIVLADGAVLLFLPFFSISTHWATLVLTSLFLLIFLFPAIYLSYRRYLLPEAVDEDVENLKELLAQNRMLIETSTDAIITSDESRQITGWNMAASRMFGYSKDEAIGRLIDILVPGHYLERHIEGFANYLKSGQIKKLGRTTEMDAVKKDGTFFPIELSLSAHKSDTSHMMTAIIRDISLRREAEAKIHHEAGVNRDLLSILEATAKTIDIDGLLKHLVESLEVVIDSDYTLSYLWDREVNLFRPSECAGLDWEMIHNFKMDSLSLEVASVKRAMEKKTFVIEDDGSDMAGIREFYHWLPHIQNAVIIPVVGRRAYLGLLVCLFKGTGGKAVSVRTEKNREVLEGVTRHVSVVLEDARMFKDSISKAMELSHKIETIQVMQEIDRSILSSLESEEIMETAAGMISRLIQCDRATVVIADTEKEAFIYAAGFGLKMLPKGAAIAYDETSGTEVMQGGMSEYISNMAESKDLLPFEQKLKDEGFLSHIRVPIIIKEEGKGFLCIGSMRPAAFTPKDMSTLEAFASQVGIALENSRLIKDIEDLFMSTIKTLSEAIDAKSSWTRGHSERVTKLALRIGREMEMNEEELKKLELTGLLHDLGKIGTYETILDKPSSLTEGETSKMRAHPSDAVKILAPIKQLNEIIPSIKAHHESYNGSGYPDGLKGKDIPPMARIISVADAVDAMGANRPYRKGLPMDEIIKELKKCSGTQLDPEVVDAFLRLDGDEEQGSV